MSPSRDVTTASDSILGFRPQFTAHSNPSSVSLTPVKQSHADMAANHPIHIHPARPFYRFTATALGASMWFFLMYRAKKDGPVLLGWKHPWDH
ncbi:hypothetical protein BJY00DRAFT_50172 [Aspergillus carlsbadensis]|nr:hypothetical protein BJY00DRAFT_50172 [Aspergillus carlsbadensis]